MNITFRFCGFFLLIFVFHANIKGQNLYRTDAAKLSFFSEARLENIEAHSNAGNSIYNANTKEIAFKIPIRSFQFRKKLMQEHFNEKYMESDKYPDATFAGKINEEINLKSPGTYNVTATGKLTMHGVTKERTIKGVIEVKAGKIILKSDFIVPVSDHKIEIPKDKFSNISQNISVKVYAEYVKK